jgi:hypothetical protein
MVNTVEDFLEDEWFQRGAECEESLYLVYLLYSCWCQIENMSQIEPNEFLSELERLGFALIGDAFDGYVRGIEFNARTQMMVALAGALYADDEENEAEDDAPFC